MDTIVQGRNKSRNFNLVCPIRDAAVEESEIHVLIYVLDESGFCTVLFG
jgi:hypothetical protein